MLDVALVNDTSLWNSHFGCQLVGQVYREQLARVGLNLKLSLPISFDHAKYSSELSRVSLVVINGEGSIHHGKNMHLVELANHFPCVLMNCVYEENPEVPALRKMLFCSSRESLSSERIRGQGVSCVVVPDMLFASSLLWSFPAKDAVYEIGSTDSVLDKGKWRKRTLADKFMRRKSGPVRSGFGVDGNPGIVVDKILSYKRLCAGRFHAAVACAILQRPFSTWDSNTWKTRGMMKTVTLIVMEVLRNEFAFFLDLCF